MLPEDARTSRLTADATTAERMSEMTSFETGTHYETLAHSTLDTFVCHVLHIKDGKALVYVGRKNLQLTLPITVRDDVERMASPYGEFSANCPW
jgi:hypothetical protein